MKRALPITVAAIVAAAGLAACGDSAPGSDGGLTVVTGAYPLEYAIARVGGDHVKVLNLTQAGADPHDLELSPRQVGEITDAVLVVYLKGFQPALDDAVAANPPAQVLEVSQAGRVDLSATEAGHEGETAQEHAAHDHGPTDPHFWLDPTRLAGTGDAIADELAALDPANADAYRTNAQALRTDLTALDEQFRTGLATCRNRDLVTAHEAFGYLAAAYDLHQVGIAGVGAESEPSPRQMADLVQHVKDSGATTVYTEVLIPPDVARTIADEAGAQTAVLDPLEGLTADNADEDYISIMEKNLETLRTGQGCS